MAGTARASWRVAYATRYLGKVTWTCSTRSLGSCTCRCCSITSVRGDGGMGGGMGGGTGQPGGGAQPVPGGTGGLGTGGPGVGDGGGAGGLHVRKSCSVR